MIQEGALVNLREVRAAADFIKQNMQGHVVNRFPFRFCLEVFHRALFEPIPIVSPSLEIGIGDGVSSYLMHRGKPDIDYGADMPFGATLESCGMGVAIQVDHYTRMVGMDMADIPFADNSFASIFSSHTMAYGQDLEVTFREILRVLTPGGTCTYAVDIDEWLHFPSIYNVLHEWVPSFEVHPKEYHIDLLRSLGATNLAWRTFFSASLEAVLQSILMVEHIEKLPSWSRVYDVTGDVFLTLIERELAGPKGPEDAFNLFITFQKPGVLPAHRPVPEPVCPRCRGSLVRDGPTRLHCASCEASYAVRNGIPIMVRQDHPGYSPVAIRERADSLAEQTDVLLCQLIESLDEGPVYVVNDGTPLPGSPAGLILLAALRFKGRSVAGVFEPRVAAGRTWRGAPVVHVKDVAATPGSLVVLVSDGEQQEVAQRVHATGVHGTLYFFVLSASDGQVHCRIDVATL